MDESCLFCAPLSTAAFQAVRCRLSGGRRWIRPTGESATTPVDVAFFVISHTFSLAHRFPRAHLESAMVTVTLDSLDLAALLCSRVCHDVISPVGAIVNGLEVLEDEN